MNETVESKRRLLIVDDSESMTELLRDIFESEGVVDTAGNGREALSKMAMVSYDVIISDIEMPVMNGIEFYKNARDRDPSIGDRILFYSCSIDDHYSFFKNLRVRRLEKPSPARELRKTVAGMIGSTHPCSN